MTIKYFSGVECGGTFTLTAAFTAPVTSCLSVYTTSFALLLALPISNLIKEKLRKNHHAISKKYFSVYIPCLHSSPIWIIVLEIPPPPKKIIIIWVIVGCFDYNYVD